MADILSLGLILIFGGLAAFFGYNYIIYRKLGLDIFLKARKSRMPLLLMETPTGIYATVPEKQIDNLAFTKEKDIIILPAGSVKSGKNLGNIQIGHGCLYLSSCIPIDLAKFCEDQKALGKSEDQIASSLEKMCSNSKAIPAEYRDQSLKDKRQYVAKTYSYSNIRSFINSGLNRVLLKRQLLILIEQNQLKNMFKGGNVWGWIMGAVVLIIILVIAWKMLFSGASPVDVVGQLSGLNRIAG